MLRAFAHRAAWAGLATLLASCACKSSSALDGRAGSSATDPAASLQPHPEPEKAPAPSAASARASAASPSPGSPPPAPAPTPSTSAGAKAPRILDPSVYAGVGPPDAALPRTPEAKRKCVVAAIGDSLTDPKSHGGGYLKVLQTLAPESRFDSYGKGGEMVNQMRRRFARDVLGEPPTPGKPTYTHVIVYGGVNDLYSDITANRTLVKITSDLRTMYEAAHERGVRVVAINVSPWGGYTRYYNDKRAQTTRALNAWIAGQRGRGNVDAVVDSYGLLSCGDRERLCPELAAPFKDGIHFGPKGHEKLGRALYDAAFRDCR